MTINLQAVCAPSEPDEKMYLTTNWELPSFKWIMMLHWDVGISINLAEFAFALMLMESSLAIEKAFDNERSTKCCCNWLWYCCLNPKINLNVGCIFLLILMRCKVLNGLFEIALISNWQMQQPTEMWKKAWCRMKMCCLLCLSRLTVASPLWLSMLSLLNWFVLLKLWAQMPTKQRHGVKLLVLKILGLLLQEIEPN